MLALLADESLHGALVDGLRRRSPELDLVRVHDVGLLSADDPTILEWAATTGRVLLTRDAATMPHYAYERVAAGLPMPGVFLIQSPGPFGAIIEEILLLVECSREGEWEGRVIYLPL